MALDIKSRFVIAAETTGQASVDNLARSVGKVEQGVSRIPQAARNAATALAGIATAGAVAFLAATKASIDFSSAIVDASERTGLGIEAFQRLQFAFAQGGVSADEFASAMAKFSVQLGKAASGSKQQAEFFESMGINAQEAVRSTAGLEGALLTIADRAQEAGSVQEAAAISTEAFGRGVGVKLVAQLRGGSEGLREFGRQASAAGAVLSEDAAKQAEALGQELENLEQIVRVQVTEGLVELTPLLKDVAEGFATGARWVGEFYTAINNVGATDSGFQRFVDGLKSIRGPGLGVFGPPGALVQGVLDARAQQAEAEARRTAGGLFGTVTAPLGGLNILGNQGIARSVLEDVLRPPRPRGGGGGGGGGGSGGAALDTDPSIFPGSQQIIDDIAAETREAERLRDVINGIEGELPALADEAGDSVAALWEANNDIAERALADLQDITGAAAQGIADTLEDGVFALFEEGTDGMVDVFNRALQRMILDLANSALKQELQSVFTDALQGSGNGGGSGLGSVFASILGAFAGGKTGTASAAKNFATGGSFVVPGPNSGDRVIPIFRANGGEVVDISQPGKRRGGGGIQVVNNIDARGADPATEVRIRREIEASERRTIAQVSNLARKGRL